MRLMGIDEAGRGCVLGSLYIGSFITEAEDPTLRAAGADDSKVLKPARRRQVLDALIGLGVAEVRSVSATAIDADNLNMLEEAVIVELIAAGRPDRVYIDALGHPRTLGRVLDRLRAGLHRHGLQPELVMEPRADATWAVVGAASIAAKVRRDADLDALRPDFGDLGSGYPSDPITRAWLLAHARSGRPWPSFVRTRWGTVRDLAPSALSSPTT